MAGGRRTASTAALLALIACLPLPLPLPAAAQNLKYDALETLFGEPVTLSATGKPQRASDVPATMEIITAEQIRRSAATDIPGILRRLAGIDVYRPSINGADVSIRGYTGPMTGRILVLIDGRQIYNDSFGFISWGLLPVELDEIRQIEVVKGPQSALYGFNAAAGVINIITFDPLDDPVNSARLRVGSQGHKEVSAVTSSKLGDRSGLRLAAGGFNIAESGNRPDPWDVPLMSPLAPQRRSVHADGVTEFDDGSRLGLMASYVSGQERRINWLYTPMMLDQTVMSTKADYSAETAIGLVSAQVFHNQFDARVDLPTWVNSSLSNSATVATLNDLFKLDAANSVRLSLEYRRNDSSVYASPGASIGYDVWSGSAMWESLLRDDLTLVNAVRYDRLQLGRNGPINPLEGQSNADFNRILDAVSFNSALVWRIGVDDTLRLTAARGFNLPTLAQLGGWDAPPTDPASLWWYGNPALQPTEVWNAELSWDHAVPALAATTRASVFYQINDKLIDFGPTIGSQNQLVMANLGGSRTVGLELGASGRLDPHWRWDINYTFQTLKDSLAVRNEFWPQYSFAGRTPRHKINGRVSYTDNPWELDLDVHYLSRYTLPDTAVFEALYDPVSGVGGFDGHSSFGDIVILEPRVAYHLTESVTAELAAQALWRRRELPLSEVEPRVLFSLVGRW